MSLEEQARGAGQSRTDHPGRPLPGTGNFNLPLTYSSFRLFSIIKKMMKNDLNGER